MSKLAPWTAAFTKKALNPKTVWGMLLIGLVLWNTFNTARELTRTHNRRKLNPYIFYGLAFSGIDKILTGTKAVGYYTDRDLDQTENAAIFAQAQYTLAPVLVEINNFDHEFILLECTSEDIAMAKVKEIGAIPVKKNKLGVILAQRKP